MPKTITFEPRHGGVNQVDAPKGKSPVPDASKQGEAKDAPAKSNPEKSK